MVVARPAKQHVVRIHQGIMIHQRIMTTVQGVFVLIRIYTDDQYAFGMPALPASKLHRAQEGLERLVSTVCV